LRLTGECNDEAKRSIGDLCHRRDRLIQMLPHFIDREYLRPVRRNRQLIGMHAVSVRGKFISGRIMPDSGSCAELEPQIDRPMIGQLFEASKFREKRTL